MLNELLSDDPVINTVEGLEQTSQQLMALNEALDGRVDKAESAIKEREQKEKQLAKLHDDIEEHLLA